MAIYGPIYSITVIPCRSIANNAYDDGLSGAVRKSGKRKLSGRINAKYLTNADAGTFVAAASTLNVIYSRKGLVYIFETLNVHLARFARVSP